jgi:hypothetical protein
MGKLREVKSEEDKRVIAEGKRIELLRLRKGGHNE